MKKTMLLIAISTTLLMSCKKTEDQNPQPNFNPSEWANLGETIFDDETPPLDSFPIHTITPRTDTKVK